MTGIADFTETERWTIQTTADERWGKGNTEPQEADVDVRLKPGDPGLTSCPALFWNVEEWNFVVLKSAGNRYRCQFFSSKNLEQMGTGIDEYDDVAECVVTLLQTQADCARSLDEGFPG
ncbi:MAG: hypothetical protein U9R74_00935 [Pseudomonadota bacterium]|nr:hypothetical protein [Pseudomonadota bacterium]